MLSQQSLLSFMCFRPFCVAYPLFLFLKVVEFGSFEKGYLNQPPGYAGSKLSSLRWLWVSPPQVSHLPFPFIFSFQGCLKVFGWAWERGLAFDSKVIQAGTNRRCLRWVDWWGNPVPVSSEVTANSQFRSTVLKVSHGEAPGNVGDLLFPDPEHFRAGELHEHVDSWKEIVTGDPTFHQSEVLSWIEG